MLLVKESASIVFLSIINIIIRSSRTKLRNAKIKGKIKTKNTTNRQRYFRMKENK